MPGTSMTALKPSGLDALAWLMVTELPLTLSVVADGRLSGVRLVSCVPLIGTGFSVHLAITSPVRPNVALPLADGFFVTFAAIEDLVHVPVYLVLVVAITSTTLLPLARPADSFAPFLTAATLVLPTRS